MDPPRRNPWRCPNCPKCGANRTREVHECSDEADYVRDVKRECFVTVYDCKTYLACGWCGHEWPYPEEAP